MLLSLWPDNSQKQKWFSSYADAQAQLEVAKKHAESLQTLAGNAEARLAEQDSLGKQFREAMEKALKDVGNGQPLFSF